MSVDSQKLQLQSEKLKAKGVSWDALARTQKLSDAHAAFLSRLNPAKITDDDSLPSTISTLSKCLETKTDATSLILVLLGDVLADKDNRIALFASQTDGIAALTRLTSAKDDFIALKSLSLLVPALVTHPASPYLKDVLANTSKLLNLESREDPDIESLMIALQCLAILFRVSQARQTAWSNEESFNLVRNVVAILAKSVQAVKTSDNGVLNGSNPTSGTSTPQPAFTSALSSSSTSDPNSFSSPQLQYYLGLTLWVLTFDTIVGKEIHSVFSKYPRLIPLLVELAKNASKEKVVRVALATFKNLANASPSINLPPMLSARLLPFLKLMNNSKKWSDEEIRSDVEFLKDQLQQAKQTLTTFDEYEQELESGYLTLDNPTHEDEEFWRLNASRLLEKNKKCVNLLVEALNSEDATTASIACNDVAQFVKYCDSARKALSDTPAKTRVMSLMNHPEQSVRFKALLAVQRLVSHSWE